MSHTLSSIALRLYDLIPLARAPSFSPVHTFSYLFIPFTSLPVSQMRDCTWGTMQTGCVDLAFCENRIPDKDTANIAISINIRLLYPLRKHPLTGYPGGLGAPTFLVENTGSKIMGPRKMTSDSIPENELEKKPGPDKSAFFST